MRLLLNAENISFHYREREVFKSISFQVGEKQLCGLFGPNGAGKTTLLKCLAGFHHITGGRITTAGHDMAMLTPGQIAKIVSYVPQEHQITFPYLVKDVVMMGRTPHLSSIFGPSSEDIEIALKTMELTGIMHIADQPYTHLSGGQRQLVLLARALAQDTPIMLLDEPASNLDFKNKVLIWNLLETLARQGKAILVCTHDPNHVLWYCNKVIVLNEEGHIIVNGRPGEKLTGNVLKKLYGDICQVGSVNTVQTVVPK